MIFHRGYWRRFRPHNLLPRDEEPSQKTDDIYVRAEAQLMATLPGRPVVKDLDSAIKYFHDRAENSKQAVDYLSSLLAQTPRAVLAQIQMDKHPRGYGNREARLYELIDFNDTYVAAVLALPELHLGTFNDDVKNTIDRCCKLVNSQCFSNEQWGAIVRGLSLEIAVYRGAIMLGYQARMTSRKQDAMGVDMVISDANGHSVNIDVKTRPAFHFRLIDLVKERRITEQQFAEAEERGYISMINGQANNQVRTTLLRVDDEIFGCVVSFSFEHSESLKEVFARIFRIER